MVDTLTGGHLLPMVTSAAILRGVGRIDSGERSASFFRFAGELSKELRPRRVTDAFCQTMITDHAIDGQVFNTDHAEAVNDLPALLVSEVLTTEKHTYHLSVELREIVQVLSVPLMGRW